MYPCLGCNLFGEIDKPFYNNRKRIYQGVAAINLLFINRYIKALPPLIYGLMIEVAEWPNVGIIPSLQVG